MLVVCLNGAWNGNAKWMHVLRSALPPNTSKLNCADNELKMELNEAVSCDYLFLVLIWLWSRQGKASECQCDPTRVESQPDQSDNDRQLADHVLVERTEADATSASIHSDALTSIQLIFELLHALVAFISLLSWCVPLWHCCCTWHPILFCIDCT